MRTRPKAVCLLSGGLDSTLAARIVLDLGVELEAVNFVTVFCTCTPGTAGCAAAVSAAGRFGIRVRTFNVTEPMIGIVRSPPHGHGTYLNPCIDCRILMFRRSLAYMREVDAQFLVTGEVLGERPMSQRRDAMLLIERESGADGLVVRPLSAALLEPSLPERKGWIDRSGMLSISGRSRRPQIALARELGINDYPCPAGGCRLTDPGFAGRMKDLLDHARDISTRDAELLKRGRHFRLTPAAKAIVGRNEEENAKLAGLAGPALSRAPAEPDASCPGHLVIEPSTVPGPTTLVVGRFAEAQIELACAISATYAGRGEPSVEFDVRSAREAPRRMRAAGLPRDLIDGLKVRPLSRGWRRAG